MKTRSRCFFYSTIAFIDSKVSLVLSKTREFCEEWCVPLRDTPRGMGFALVKSVIPHPWSSDHTRPLFSALSVVYVYSCSSKIVAYIDANCIYYLMLKDSLYFLELNQLGPKYESSVLNLYLIRLSCDSFFIIDHRDCVFYRLQIFRNYLLRRNIKVLIVALSR